MKKFSSGFCEFDKIILENERYVQVTDNSGKTVIVSDTGERRFQTVDAGFKVKFNPPLNKPALTGEMSLEELKISWLPSNYSIEHQERLAKSDLPNCEHKVFDVVDLGETSINISGKECKVAVTRNSSGNIEIEPIDEGITSEGGWLYYGTTSDVTDFEISIYQYNE